MTFAIFVLGKPAVEGGGSMHLKLRWCFRFVSAVLSLALLAPNLADGQPLPRSVAVASNPPGTVF